MGLWLDLPELSRANRGPGRLAASLQLASTAQRHRGHRTHVQTQICKQPLDGSQLVKSAHNIKD